MSMERIKKRVREEEKEVSSVLYLQKNYQVVKEIKTPQCVLIPFWFPACPFHCPQWEKEDLNDAFHKLSVEPSFFSEKKEASHWDLFPLWFSFELEQETLRGKTPLLKPLKKKDPRDILIQVSSKVTWVFRPFSPEELEKRGGYLVKHLMAGTHVPSEKPVHQRAEIRILSLILKEYHQKERSCIILDESYWYTYSNKQKMIKDKLPYLYLYEALLAYYQNMPYETKC